MDKYKNVFELKLIKNKCTGNGPRYLWEIFFGLGDLSRATSESLHKATLQTKISEKAAFNIRKQNEHTQWDEKKQENLKK